MAKHRTRKQKSKTGRIQQRTGTHRETAGRRMRAAPKVKGKGKAQKKAKSPLQSLPKSAAGTNRAEGIRLFTIAGRPSPAHFVLVYGERGPRMTWDERAKAGVSAKQFQTALAAKQAGR